MVCCVDVGGTTIKVGVLAESGVFTSLLREPTPRGQDVPRCVADLFGKVRADHDVAALGVAVPGIVDESRGIAVLSANLGWRDLPFADELQRMVDLPVAFGHDVRAGGLAEAKQGSARGYGNVVFVPIGTGIAAALLFDGQPYASGGWAGELGHVDVGHGQPCPCGQNGCLEALSSAAAIIRRYRELRGTSRTGAKDAADVANLATDGDETARRVWDEAIDGLAHGLSATVALLAPEVIVIGGGLAAAGDQLFQPLQQRLAERLTLHRPPPLVPAALGDQAGCIGAGHLAFDRLGEWP
jgi:glucokinase